MLHEGFRTKLPATTATVCVPHCRQQMNTPFQFPCLSLQQLKEFCPSKAKGRNWRSELAYRDECIDRINNTCDELKM